MPEALHKRHLDLALLRRPFADPDLAPELIYSEPLVFAIRQDHPLPRSGAKSLSLKQAMSFDLIGYARQNSRYFSQIFQLRSEEHTSELQSLMRISYAVFCLKKKQKNNT